MADILLINPFTFDKLDFSIGVLEIATILDNSNYNVKIIDMNYLYRSNINFLDESMDKLSFILKCIFYENPKIIGFSCMCNNYHFLLKITEKIKEIDPNIKIFFGGPHATLTAEKTLKSFKSVDLICQGESETYIIDVIDALLNNKSLDSIKGIVYLKNGIIKSNKKANLILDLDKLPLLNYKLIEYFDDIEWINIEVGRGCPFSCTFCSTKTFWNQKTRMKSIDRIVKEIIILKTIYNKTKINFIHDLFTVNSKYIKEFCERIIELDINIKWTCSSRIDTVNKDLLNLMKKAGCVSIFFGVETGSEKLQNVICKNLKINNIYERLTDLKETGFYDSTFSFIYGFPQEDEIELKKTINLAFDIIKKFNFKVMLGRFTFLPETELYLDYKDKIIYDGNTSFIAEDITYSEYEDIIKNNKEIFPHFFSYQTELHKKYIRLEKFFEFYTIIIINFKCIAKALEESKLNNIMLLYRDFSTYYNKEICDILDIGNTYFDKIKNENYEKNKLNEVLELIKDYVNKHLEKNNTFIMEIIDFEYNLMFANKNIIKKIYENDIVAYRQMNKKISECKLIKNEVTINKKNNIVNVNRHILV